MRKNETLSGNGRNAVGEVTDNIGPILTCQVFVCHAYSGKFRNITKGVKLREKEACQIMAEDLSRFVHEVDILIPAPNHEGQAIYTRTVANEISKRTGAATLDILRREPSDTAYIKNKQLSKTEKSFRVDLFLKDETALKAYSGKRLFFVDNVVDTGCTFKKAATLIKGLLPLSYATTERYLKL